MKSPPAPQVAMVIYFEHLTLVQGLYHMTQVLTTVGYGDINNLPHTAGV